MNSKRLISLFMLLAIALSACGSDAGEQEAVTIGVLDSYGLDTQVEGFKAGLIDFMPNARLNYIQPQLGIDQLDAALDDIVAAQPDVIFCVGTEVCQQVKRAAPDIPLVFAGVNDPLGAGLIQDYTEPGGMATGIASAAPNEPQEGKRFEWLIEAAPNTERVLIIFNPENVTSMVKLASVMNGAQLLGIELVQHVVRTPADVEALITNFPDDVDAAIIFSDHIYTDQLVAAMSDTCLSKRIAYSAPTIDSGALLSFDSDPFEIGIQSARLAFQVIKGNDPAQLPVELPAYYLRVNLATAEVLGLTIPRNVLNGAVEIVYPEPVSMSN